jgi:hypothetical protein
MGPTAVLPLRRKACWGFFRPKNPTASTGCKPANLVPMASMLPLMCLMCYITSGRSDTCCLHVLIIFVTCLLHPVTPLLVVTQVCHLHPRYPDPYTCFVLVNIYHLTSQHISTLFWNVLHTLAYVTWFRSPVTPLISDAHKDLRHLTSL